MSNEAYTPQFSPADPPEPPVSPPSQVPPLPPGVPVQSASINADARNVAEILEAAPNLLGSAQVQFAIATMGADILTALSAACVDAGYPADQVMIVNLDAVRDACLNAVELGGSPQYQLWQKEHAHDVVNAVIWLEAQP